MIQHIVSGVDGWGDVWAQTFDIIKDCNFKLNRIVRFCLFVCLFVGRFEKGRIYTFIGEVVVSVNPYKQMDIYGKAIIDAYRGRELYENPPHLYSVADAAYKAMKRRAKDTCIVISGQLKTPA